LQHEQGIPASQTGSEQETPPSGISRVIERQELIESRYADQKVLHDFEQDLVTLVLHIATRDGVEVPAYTTDDVSVSITYSEEQLFIEPTDEFEFDTSRKDSELIPLRAYFEKWGTGFTSEMKDNEFIEELTKQVEMNKRIKEVLSNSGDQPDTSVGDVNGADDDSQGEGGDRMPDLGTEPNAEGGLGDEATPNTGSEEEDS